MKQDRPSSTALGIALLRALESEKPAGERICYDPFARRFVPTPLYLLGKFFVVIGYAEKRGPGVMGFLAARARYMDDYLLACLEEGLEQVVILGAGYDSRAYRFDRLRGRVKVFEVDHPATQRAKQQKLRKTLGKLPEHVVYVPIDFSTETLENRLCESGYDPRQKTLFIWEGVTQYLPPEAIDSTLAFVAHRSGQGSSIVFDYMYTWMLEGKARRAEVSGMRRYSPITGESLVFGIPEGRIEPFLEQRGFDRVKDVTAGELRDLYFTGVNCRRQVASGYAIASARVRSSR